MLNYCLSVNWGGIKFNLVIILSCFCEISLGRLNLGKEVKNVVNQVKINICIFALQINGVVFM